MLTPRTSYIDQAAKKEWIEERAAILEYDAGLPRGVAETKAMKMWEQMHREKMEADRKAR